MRRYASGAAYQNYTDPTLTRLAAGVLRLGEQPSDPSEEAVRPRAAVHVPAGAVTAGGGPRNESRPAAGRPGRHLTDPDARPLPSTRPDPSRRRRRPTPGAARGSRAPRPGPRPWPAAAGATAPATHPFRPGDGRHHRSQQRHRERREQQCGGRAERESADDVGRVVDAHVDPAEALPAARARSRRSPNLRLATNSPTASAMASVAWSLTKEKSFLPDDQDVQALVVAERPRPLHEAPDRDVDQQRDAGGQRRPDEPGDGRTARPRPCRAGARSTSTTGPAGPCRA